MVQQIALGQARNDFRIFNSVMPDADGPRCLPLPYTLVANEPFNIDLTLADMQGLITGIHTVYIDNYDGTAGVTLTCETTGQRIKVEAGSARYCPVLSPTPKFSLVSTAGQTGRIIFINVPIAAIEQDVADSASIVAQLAAILAAVDTLEALVTTGNAQTLAIEQQTQQPNATARLLTSAASVNETAVKNAAGKLFKVIGKCNAGAPVYLKIYDKASAINFAADTPVFTVQLDPLVNVALDFGGHVFATGIRFAITAAIGDTDTTAIALGDVTALNVEYR